MTKDAFVSQLLAHGFEFNGRWYVRDGFPSVIVALADTGATGTYCYYIEDGIEELTSSTDYDSVLKAIERLT